MALTWWQRRRWAVALTVIVAALLLPAAASAHGPVDPAASSYQARIGSLPAGVRARVVDGDQRLWLSVTPGRSVTVVDYEGAPYLRFTAAGVAVNRASEMYYSNQVPAEIAPPGTGPHTPPQWMSTGSGHSYEWHDGRLHALAATALAPGARDLGRWRIPLTVDGRPAAITGDLLYAASPSIVWFWPIAVCLLCVLAALRLRRRTLDARVGRILAGAALVAFAVAGIGQQLHGRPTVSLGQQLTLAVMAAFVGWAAFRLTRRPGWFMLFVIAAAAIWEGVSLLSVLLDGYVLLAVPAFLARAAVVTCLGCGVALLAVVFALAERGDGAAPWQPSA